jgi:hypothetical protein
MDHLTARRAALDSRAAHRREGHERDRRADALAGDMLVAILNATPRNDEPGTAPDHDRPRTTTFPAPGGRLARRHHHRPQRDRLLKLAQRGEEREPVRLSDRAHASEPRPTSPGAAQKARPIPKSAAASSATSPGSSTARLNTAIAT